MKWTIEYYNQKVQDWVSKMPIDLRAAYARLTTLLTEYGMDLRLPHSRAMGDNLFELRPRAKEGIARIFYCTLIKKRIIILHGFIKKTPETPPNELKIARRRMKEVKHEQKK